MALTRKQRAEIISSLTTNCECWQHEGSEEILANMADDQLAQVAESAATEQQASMVANAAMHGFTDEQNGVMYRLNGETGAWERKVLTANVNRGGSGRDRDEEPTTNAPPWLKSKQDDEEDVGPDNMEEEITEEDTPPEKPMSKCAMMQARGGKGKMQYNSRGKNMSLKSMLREYGTPEEIAVWNHAVDTWEQQKRAMVDRIVANHKELANEDMASRRESPIYNRLMQKTPEELQEMLDIIPVANAGPAMMVGGGVGVNYAGAAGGPLTANRFANHDAEDILPLPRNDWEVISNGNGKSKE